MNYERFFWVHDQGSVTGAHLPILGADAHMLSTFIQTDLVDLHWTLRKHNIKASFFLEAANIFVADQMLLPFSPTKWNSRKS